MDATETLKQWAMQHVADQTSAALHAETLGILKSSLQLVSAALGDLDRRISQVEASLAEVDERAGAALRGVNGNAELLDDIVTRVGALEESRRIVIG